MKRFLAVCLLVVLVISAPMTAYACDENQSETYVKQIMFGDSASSHQSDEQVTMLMDALYLCCEQADNNGQDKIDFLRSHRVIGLPSLANLNIKGKCLPECSHNSWEYEYTGNIKVQNNRKKVLLNTVNKVFDFGVLNKLLGGKSGKCNSFAALLYYSHILSDYMASNPDNTEATVRGKCVEGFSGQPYVMINGNKPFFTADQKDNIDTFLTFSSLDGNGRCGEAFANISKDTLPPPNSRKTIDNIKPSGWVTIKYPGIVNSYPAYLYNRCHLIAHQLSGNDGVNNLITGTRYLNENGMKPFEDKVVNYIKETGNHVLYRATPVYMRDNRVASGVQLEAYSIEDSGKGICFNVYCYNVQPGIELNYSNGSNAISDVMYNTEKTIPFVVDNPSDNNPDLTYEMKKHLEILFSDSRTRSTYDSMIGQLNSIANDARAVGSGGESDALIYMKLKEYEFKYFKVLKDYVPLLLEKQSYFQSAFMLP